MFFILRQSDDMIVQEENPKKCKMSTRIGNLVRSKHFSIVFSIY